jgi:hypothetical protein
MTDGDSNSIIPGVKAGPYYLSWDLEKLKQHMPEDYSVIDGMFYWFVNFDNYEIRIRKIDNKIDAISVKNNFKESFMGKITRLSTFRDIENEFGPLVDVTEFFYLPDYRGMNFYFEDERDDIEWDETKVIEILVEKPKFDWNKDFTLEDYEEMEKTQYTCLFPRERIKEIDKR